MECGIFDVACWWDVIVIGVVNLFAAIPVPDVLTTQITLPAVIGFYADAAQFQEGMLIIFGAYGSRFLLRRIPVIG